MRSSFLHHTALLQGKQITLLQTQATKCHLLLLCYIIWFVPEQLSNSLQQSKQEPGSSAATCSEVVLYTVSSGSNYQSCGDYACLLSGPSPFAYNR